MQETAFNDAAPVQIGRLLNDKNLPEVLQKARNTAAENFQKVGGFPDTGHEEWKYTNLRKLTARNYDFEAGSVANAALIEQKTAGLTDENTDLLVVVNGRFSAELSKFQKAENGIRISSLAQAFTDSPEIIATYFGTANTENEAVTAANTALSANGIFVYVPKNIQAGRKVVVCNLADSSAGNAAVFSRHLIVAETGASVQVCQLYVSEGENFSWTNSVTEIFVAENASVNHYKIQNESEKASHTGRTFVRQKSDSRFTDNTITVNGELVRNNLDIKLDGSNCEAYMNGLYVPTGHTQVDNHSSVDHMKPHSYSDQMYKGILNDRAKGVFNGKIFVREDAQKTNAFQSNKNVLLSDEVSMNSKPQLEIWADDVKCSHGCTTGAPDEEPMFYLRSRGIPERDARTLLLFAFADDLLDRIKDENLREYAVKLVHEKIK